MSLNTIALKEATLRMRVNQIDYTVQPSGALDNTVLPRVPIIRIYGVSSTGKKACVHVHQVYPYFFLEYLGRMDPDEVNRYIARLMQSLNHAIAVSLRRIPNSPNSQFIRAVILVKGVHFYGFNSSYSPFLKVHLTDPAVVNRAVTLLQAGTIMKTHFRVYESHLSFILQFMSDFGLYGCGWIDLAETWQRDVLEQGDENEGMSSSFSSEASMLPSPHHRQTRMPLELDVAAHQIFNRHLLSARNIHHKLSIPAFPLPPEPVVLSVRELWEDERRRRLARGLTPSPVLPRDPSESSRESGGDWAAEARWWDEVRRRIEREREQEPERTPSTAWERWVMTTFDSVEALWEPEYKTWKPAGPDDGRQHASHVALADGDNPYGLAALDGFSSQSGSQAGIVSGPESEIEVDEGMLLSQEMMSRMVAQEEDDWAKRDTDPQGVDNNGDAVEEPTVPEPQEDDDATPHTSPSKVTPSKAAQLEAYHRALQKIAGRTRSMSGSPDQNATPKQIRLLSPSPGKPRQYPKMPAKPFPRTPVLDSDENPFLEKHVVTLQEGPILDTSPENPFLDDDARTLSESNGKGPTAFVDPEHQLFQIPRAGPTSATAPPKHPQSPTPVQLNGLTAAADDQHEEDRPSKRRKLDFLRTPSSEVPHVASSLSSTQKAASFPPANPSGGCTAYKYVHPPPSTSELLSTLDAYGIPAKVHQTPYYSIESDVPERPREYAGLVYHLKGGIGIASLEEWKNDTTIPQLPWRSGKLNSRGVHGWEYAGMPPSVRQVKDWLKENKVQCLANKPKKASQIIGPTQANPYGLNSRGSIVPNSTRESGGMTILALEVFAPSQGQHLPDPGNNVIVAVFYACYDSDDKRQDHSEGFHCKTGIITVKNAQCHPDRLRDWTIHSVADELDLINSLADLVVEMDPDIVTGWEVQAASWGYLAARAGTYGLDIGEQISRAPGRHVTTGSDQWGLRTTSTFKVIGRHVLNLWRVMRLEQSLPNYTFESVVFDTLRRRTPRYTSSTLTEWFHSNAPENTSRLFKYFNSRTSMVLEIIEVAEIVTKTSEFARVFGVDFFSVISRGSQFKVESFMSRIAKPESFVLLSPSKQDVGKQNAAECMPLIMEPLSAFYSSPLLVLDFQSLYPSVMIAYNYCYSTCLGRIVDFKGQNKFGVTELHQPPGLLETLQDHVNVSPNGMVFVRESVRKGLLGRMLTELLGTRVMVKQAMKDVKDDKSLQRVLNARQLAMKFIANVTYGYTSATYSGRMPAVEIADAIVQSGRETLEKAIRVIDSTRKWGAKVVYGDTDSLFVYLPGKTKDQAFRIGNDIADVITKMNPSPIKLKFEKVYLPCLLMAKKRYVGFKYENPDDKEPVFDAKGIETVRRDGVPAQRKMTETCLKILFRTQDLSKVKDYCCTTWAQILENKVSLQDFIFAKEVRMGTYSDKGPPPPGVAVAARRMAEDPNDEPQYGDRIPYVIIRGSPGMRLVDRAVPPEDALNDLHKHIDATYYISRVLIPPLERIFNLVGADVRSWYDEMPKALRAEQPESVMVTPRKASKQAALISRYKIDEHFYSSHCLACGAPSTDVLCDACRWQPSKTVAGLSAKLNRSERRLCNVQLICASCSQVPTAEPIRCESLDCPWLYERKKVEYKAESLQLIRDIVDDLEADVAEESTSLVDDGTSLAAYEERDQAESKPNEYDNNLKYTDPARTL